MKIVLISFFRSANLGDLLIAKNLFSSLENDQIIGVDFPTASRIDQLEVDFVQRKIVTSKKINSIKNILLSCYSYLRLKLNKSFWEEYRNLVSKADILIIGGGNMMMDTDFAPIYSYLFYKYIKIASSYNKKIYVVSVGVGPFKNFMQTHYIKKAVKRAKHIWTRDTQSLGVLKRLDKKCDASLSADAAFAYMLPPRKISENRKIGVCITDFICVSDFCDYDSYSNTVKNMLAILNEEFPGYKIEVFSTEKRDYCFINELFEKKDLGQDIAIRKITSMDELKLFYNEIDFLIGMRMHSLIVGMIYHLPCFAISWQNKINSLFEDFDITEQCINFTIDYYDIKKYISNISSQRTLFQNIVDHQDKHVDIGYKRFYDQLHTIFKDNDYNEEKLV